MKAHLQFLDLFLQLRNQRLFIFKLGCQRGDLLVLALDRLLQLLLVALKIGHGLLSQLQVTLNFSLSLLNVTTKQRVISVSSLLRLEICLVRVRVEILKRDNKTAKRVLCDAVHTLYQGVLYFLNIARFHVAHDNLLCFTNVRTALSFRSRFTRHSEMLSSILFESLVSDLTKIGQYMWKVGVGINLPSK